MRLPIKVRAGARRSRLAGKHGEEWKVEVAAPAVNGKANRALIEFFAQALGLPRSAVRIFHGERSPHKVLEIEGSEAEMLRRFEELSSG